MWDDRMWGSDMWDTGMHGWGGWWALVVLAGVLLLIAGAAVLVAILLGRSSRSQVSPPGYGASEADRMLDERFARGEIDEQEYLQRRAVLRGR